jgi:hypothetical protein
MDLQAEQLSRRLSSWWRYGALSIVLAEFIVLGVVPLAIATVRTYFDSKRKPLDVTANS